MSKKLIITMLISLSIISIIAFLYWQNTNIKNELYKAEASAGELTAQLLAYGDVKNIYIANKQLKTGEEVKTEDFKTVSVPSSMITESFIKSPNDVIGGFYKVNISEGTPITKDLIAKTDIDKTLRYLDVISDVFPIEPNAGDYYDFRLVTPNGQDYLFMTKKRIHDFYGTAVRIFVDENDIHRYQSALVDAFLNPGSLIYVTRYVEPSMQESAEIYYPVSDVVLQVMEADPNIVNLAEQDLKLRRRTAFENGLTTDKDEQSMITAGRSELVKRISEAGQEVLKGNYSQGNEIEDGALLEKQQSELESKSDTTNTNKEKTTTNNLSTDQKDSINNIISNPDNAADKSLDENDKKSFYDNYYNPAETNPFDKGSE